MSDPRILVCGPALDLAESAARLEMLRLVDLPNATKFVVTTGKFDAQKAARTFNVETNYPVEPPILHTLACWADSSNFNDLRHRDGFDLFSLRRILAEHAGFDFAVLLRDGTDFEKSWSGLLSNFEGRQFLIFTAQSATDPAAEPADNLLLDLRTGEASAFLDAVGEIFETGLSYALTDYSLERALNLALEALQTRKILEEALPQTLTMPATILTDQAASEKFDADAGSEHSVIRADHQESA